MATTAGINLHVDPSEITHRYKPADDDRAGYGTLVLGKPGRSAYANLFFEDAAAIDAVIAELVALKQEMDPPVIPPAERDCPHLNPDGGWPCHRGGDHGVHQDSNGSEWRTDGTELFISGSPFCPARRGIPGQGGDLCELPLGHDGDHRAPGDDEGDPDVTWSDEAAAVLS